MKIATRMRLRRHELPQATAAVSEQLVFRSCPVTISIGLAKSVEKQNSLPIPDTALA